MQKKYEIYGNYGLVDEYLLNDFTDFNEAIRWFESYTKMDLGGYITVELGWFNEFGEWITERVKRGDE